MKEKLSNAFHILQTQRVAGSQIDSFFHDEQIRRNFVMHDLLNQNRFRGRNTGIPNSSSPINKRRRIRNEQESLLNEKHTRNIVIPNPKVLITNMEIGN